MKYYKTGFTLEPREGSMPITDEYWQELLEGESRGKIITPDDKGYPILVDYIPTQEELDAKEMATLKAYLDETDYIYPKCFELELDANSEYAGVVQKRKEARTRIQTLTRLYED